MILIIIQRYTLLFDEGIKNNGIIINILYKEENYENKLTYRFL